MTNPMPMIIINTFCMLLLLLYSVIKYASACKCRVPSSETAMFH